MKSKRREGGRRKGGGREGGREGGKEGLFLRLLSKASFVIYISMHWKEGGRGGRRERGREGDQMSRRICE